MQLFTHLFIETVWFYGYSATRKRTAGNKPWSSLVGMPVCFTGYFQTVLKESTGVNGLTGLEERYPAVAGADRKKKFIYLANRDTGYFHFYVQPQN